MKKLILCLFVLISSDAYSQSKYWIYFTDKAGTPPDISFISERTRLNRATLQLDLIQYSDVPLSHRYLDILSVFYHVTIINKSKWLNAASAYLNRQQVEAIRHLAFVKGIVPIKSGHLTGWNKGLESVEYYVSEQINAGALRNEALTGENVIVGIIDGRFTNSNMHPTLKHIIKGNRILGTRDFVEPDKVDFFKEEKSPEAHGTAVLRKIAAIESNNRRSGLASGASFYLARTDNAEREFRQEEDYWVAALEWMDSLGVRLVNSSIGYSYGFDNPKENYSPKDMNGHTTAITKAAQIAAEKKGMIIVVAAGNDGGEKLWRVVAAPADAKGVISVGATNQDWSKAHYSAIGPQNLSYLKPNIAVFSNQGTSLSAPVITALLACIMQKQPNLTREEAQKLLEKSGHLYPYANNYIGYGIPDARRMLDHLKKLKVPVSSEKIEATDAEVLIKRKEGDVGKGIAFHKSNRQIVESQNQIKFDASGTSVIRKQPGVERTTIAFNTRVIEIIWK
ncbi:S8 family serine peptidase [Fulvivirgaceae bacterium BMA12]|uniref:S8 family serine peptidase n=1 Tax=Agaribacillus aureus TaxID=3051825 RepID=A0ABT8LJ26_9BACT|nr:S8 family serine peptidase [Fulvivirgaceae bacterium BMA12]